MKDFIENFVSAVVAQAQGANPGTPALTKAVAAPGTTGTNPPVLAQPAQAQTAPTAKPAKAKYETKVMDITAGKFYCGTKSVYYITSVTSKAPGKTTIDYWKLSLGTQNWFGNSGEYENDYVWKVAEIPNSVGRQLPPCPGLNQSVKPRITKGKVNIIPENKNSAKCVKCGGKNKKVQLLISETYYCPTCEA